jgi:hypothetical protein
MGLHEDRQRGFRDFKDGEPFYCKLCGMGWNEFGACEEPDCELESKEEAMKRYQPTGEFRR